MFYEKCDVDSHALGHTSNGRCLGEGFEWGRITQLGKRSIAVRTRDGYIARPP